MAEFKQDLKKGRRAEQIVLNILKDFLPAKFEIEDVGANKEYYYLGDIKLTNKLTGAQGFVEVKNDERINETHNVLCEWGYSSGNKYFNGNMKNGGEFYAVVDEVTRTVYFLDYIWLRANYKQGKPITIQHETQTTFATLLPLSFIKENGGLLHTFTY